MRAFIKPLRARRGRRRRAMRNEKSQVTSEKSEYMTAVLEFEETVDLVRFGFAPSRREFVRVLGAGLLIAVCVSSAEAQERPQGQRRGGGGFRGGGPTPIAARLHIGKDGLITLLTGKVECGQGARAEITQAAAEELRVPASRVTLVMADTALVPNDGITAGGGGSARGGAAGSGGGGGGGGVVLWVAGGENRWG